MIRKSLCKQQTMQLLYCNFRSVTSSIDGLSNQGEFYTDSNGRQFVRRLRDQRPSYNPLNASIEEPVSSNYYPIGKRKLFRYLCIVLRIQIYAMYSLGVPEKGFQFSSNSKI